MRLTDHEQKLLAANPAFGPLFAKRELKRAGKPLPEPRKRSKKRPPPADIHEGPCVYRGDALRQQTCDTCSNRGTVKTIYACPKHEECFEGLGGFRIGSGKGPSRTIQACRYCDDHSPATPARP